MKNFTVFTPSNATIVAMLLLATGMTGCSSFKNSLNNHSLDYTKTRKLEPIQIPADAQTQTFVPIYTVPETGGNTLDTNSGKSKRFVLPKPHSSIQ